MRAGVLDAPDSPESWERHTGAACAPLAGYQRREPEKTLLHQVVREQLETFLAAAREKSAHGRGLPAFVERDLRAYLASGMLARGFARVRCPGCGFERLVAFSCKTLVCPSCAARRMEDGADHLVRNVLPPVPVRQWVLSFPRRVRFLAARHPALASRLLDVFTRWSPRRTRWPPSRPPRWTGGCGSPTTSGTAATAPSSTASRSTLASVSTATIATGGRGCAATPCAHRSRCNGSRRARMVGSSTG